MNDLGPGMTLSGYFMSKSAFSQQGCRARLPLR